MAPTFTLANVLAIIIPLGVVCLVAILVLGMVFFRFISISARQKQIHEPAKKKEHQFRATNINSFGSQTKHNRSFLDILCCIPANFYTQYSGPQKYKDAYSPKLDEQDHRFGIPDSQRRLSDASKSQSLQAQLLQLNKPNRNSREKQRKESIGPEEVKHKTRTLRTESGGGVLNKEPEQGVSGITTPESATSTPKSLSIQDLLYSKQKNEIEGKFPHPYAEGSRQPPIDSTPSSITTSAKQFEIPLQESFSPLPAPPGFKAPSPHTPSSTRLVRNEYTTKDPGIQAIQTSPSFASKLRSLTSYQQNEPYYPAKSELRSKHSWKKTESPVDDTISNREYFSATNSLKSNIAGIDSPYSVTASNAHSDQKSHSMAGSPINGLSLQLPLNNSLSENKVTFSPRKNFTRIEETPQHLTSFKPEESFNEFFKSPELAMTPPPPPASRQSQRASPSTTTRPQMNLVTKTEFNKSSKEIKKDNYTTAFDERVTKKSQSSAEIKEPPKDVASLSNDSVVAPDKIMKVLQGDEQIVEGRKHFGITQVTRGHSVTPSYSGSFIQPLSTENNNIANNQSGLMRAYPLAQVIDPRESVSSGSKQSTPLDKMSNYITPMDYTMNADLETHHRDQVENSSKHNSKLHNKEQNSLQIAALDQEDSGVIKGFSKSSAQLSSPLGSPHSSYVPSRHSSLSNNSLRRSKTFLNDRAFNYLRNKLNDFEGSPGSDAERSLASSKLTAETNTKSNSAGLSITPEINTSEQTFGTISAIAALNPPASPRSPGYEPSKGALIANSIKHANKSAITPTRRGTNSPAVKKYPRGTEKSSSHLDQKKKKVLKTRLNKPLPSTPIILEDGVVSHLHGEKFLVIASYKSRLSDEIDLEVGDIVKVNEVFDDNWCRARIVQSSLPTINRNPRGVCPKACLSERPLDR